MIIFNRKLKCVAEDIIETYDINESRINIFQNKYIYLDDVKDFKIGKKFCFILLNNNNKIIVLSMKYKTSDERKEIKEIFDSNVRFKSIYKSGWILLASAIIICITLLYGYKIYNTAINYNGKLSWVLESLRNERNIDFKHNNIYEYGIEGIFTDIEEKVDLPDELYISEVFDLTFSSDGTITSFYTFIYGNNDKGDFKSFLIDYNINRSKNIIIHLDGYVNADYSKDMLLKPLRDTMNVIHIKDTVSKWNSDEYGILYYYIFFKVKGKLTTYRYKIKNMRYNVMSYTINLYGVLYMEIKEKINKK